MRYFVSMLVLAFALVFKASPALAREWTDASGTFSVEAEFVRVDGDSLVLRKADGLEIKVPIVKLSVTDQAIVRAAAKPAIAAAKPEIAAAKPVEANQPAVAPRVGNAAIMHALANPGQLAFADLPLNMLPRRLQETAGLPLHIDGMSLQNAGLNRNTPLTYNGKQEPLGTALANALKPAQLTFVVQDDLVIICTMESAQQRLVTRVYAVPRGFTDFDGLIAQITSKVAPTSWNEVGGPGSICYLDEIGKVIVAQSSAVQLDIERQYSRTLKPIARPEVRLQKPPAQGKVKALAAIHHEMQRTFVEIPLRKIMADLSTHHHVSIEIDSNALDEIGQTADVPITWELTGMRLGSALRHMLHEHGLIWALGPNDSLFITTWEAQEQKLIQATYPVGDLTPNRDYDAVIEAITQTVSPTSWNDVGGPCRIATNAGRAGLDISAPFHIQQEVNELLTALRAKN